MRQTKTGLVLRLLMWRCCCRLVVVNKILLLVVLDDVEVLVGPGRAALLPCLALALCPPVLEPNFNLKYYDIKSQKVGFKINDYIS